MQFYVEQRTMAKAPRCVLNSIEVDREPYGYPLVRITADTQHTVVLFTRNRSGEYAQVRIRAVVQSQGALAYNLTKLADFVRAMHYKSSDVYFNDNIVQCAELVFELRTVHADDFR